VHAIVKHSLCVQSALTLLAYQEPMNSPAAQFFEPDSREQCASAVNSALMELQGAAKYSRLELLCSQTALVQAELFLQDCPEVNMLRIDEQ
jgi:CTLH/CRA C-terminal to LisH motif domain